MNPAGELLEIFTEWKDGLSRGNHTADMSRGFSDPKQFVATHVKVFRLLDQIDSAFQNLEDRHKAVEVFRRHQQSWMLMALNHYGTWTNSAPAGQLFPQADMEQLEGFARYLDEVQSPYDPAQITQVRVLLDEVERQLTADPNLDDLLKGYLNDLVRHIRNAIVDATYRDLNVPDLMRQLWVALNATIQQSKGPNKTKWRKLLNKLESVPLDMAAAIGVAVVTHALTGS